MESQKFLYHALTLEGRVDMAVERIKVYQPTGKPYYGCFSGGKDSVVIKRLAEMAGVPVEWHYNVTTIDPPELVQFILKEHSDVKMDRPKRNFFKLVPTNGLPTRLHRWCCRAFKESKNPPGAVLLMGVRAAESPRRKKAWGVCTIHKRTRTNAINPIVDWPDAVVWQFIRAEGIPYCALYDEGFKRLGCIGCPMAGKKRAMQFERWPRYERLWKRATKKTWEWRHEKEHLTNKFDDWQSLWDWWMSDKAAPKADDCQGLLDMFS